MSRKKPNIYTKTGKAKKPAAPKATVKAHDVAALIEQVDRFQKHALYWENLYYSWQADQAARTTKLCFGWGLIKPIKK